MQRFAFVRVAYLGLSGALLLLQSALAAPPDLTDGGVPDSTRTQNLGPTGARGWVYVTSNNEGTIEARQIQVQIVDTGSPAAGILATNDVILGADGTGSTATPFTYDARKALADAIADAEARDPATLNLMVWRSGVTNNFELTLQTMGAYSATAPYNCPKSARILSQGVDFYYNNGVAGRGSFGLLTLLAYTNSAYYARAQTEARELIPTEAEMAEMMAGVRSDASAWNRGYKLLTLSQYYLATGDTNVLPAIEARATEVARNQSLFGTLGHIFADKNKDGSDNGPMGGGYGVINTPGLACFTGLLLAQEGGVTNEYITPAIERTSRFFAYYAGKGSIPYGEHTPYNNFGGSNGKNALAALAFALQTNRVEECNFFSKMCASASEKRESGHTGPFFEYLWGPLGANLGGEAAMASFFSRISWHLDLQRRWDGSFAYDNLRSDGGAGNGTDYAAFDMGAAMMLTYATPHRRLHITGADPDPAHELSAGDVTNTEWAASYDPTTRTDAELISDLETWAPPLASAAAKELGLRTIDTTELDQIIAMALDTNSIGRAGACEALGQIANTNAMDELVTLLTDSENNVRYHAADALRFFGGRSVLAAAGFIDEVLSAAATTAHPLWPMVEEDPVHFAHGRLCMLLFYGGNAYGPKGILYQDMFTGIDTNLLYPAIKAVAYTPAGQSRSTVGSAYGQINTPEELPHLLAISGAVVDGVYWRAPADKMFSTGVRTAGLALLERYGIAEGPPCGREAVEDDANKLGATCLGTLELYGAANTNVVPDAGMIEFLEGLIGWSLAGGSLATEAEAVMLAITNDPSPYIPMPLKSIVSVSVDDDFFNLTAPTPTTLRVVGHDYAEGDSVYTWRKVHGASDITFTPNGTTNSANTGITFDIPGLYKFEVTMSDSRGLTEASTQIVVTVYDAGGIIPANDPPTADPQSVELSQDTQIAFSLSSTDPEGYPIVYNIVTPPANGTVTLEGSNVVYKPNTLYVGPDSFVFEAMDSNGQTDTATVTIAVNSVPLIPALYEPFDYPVGLLNGASGSTEVGLDGAWAADVDNTIVDDNLTIGLLETTGRRVKFKGGSNRYGGKRTINPAALAGSGLLDDGATLWMSYISGLETNANRTNSRFALALATDSFSTGKGQYWLQNTGSYGVGVYMPQGSPRAGEFFDSTIPTPAYDADASGAFDNGQQGVIICKFTWGDTPADPDTIELYAPGSSLTLMDTPFSTYTTTVDQAALDTLTFSWGDLPMLDEIRCGPTYASVVPYDGARESDPPTPDPMTFASLPAKLDSSSVAMTATTALDYTNPVEYYFENTNTLDNSGWILTTGWTNTNLTFGPDTIYAYRVKARDAWSNETAWSEISLVGGAAPGGIDAISVNFYDYGGMTGTDQQTVTIEQDQAAGEGLWSTLKWTNIFVAAMSSVAVQSAEGASASLTISGLLDGSPYADVPPRSTLIGDADADLMDGHANGRAQANKDFIMSVDSIPFTAYDVIVYMNCDETDGGDRTGTYILNAGPETGFTLPTGEFAAFSAITNSTTPGNYLFFGGLTGSSLSLNIKGVGSNRLGPAGFQIRETDDAAPTPNPMTFASPPAATASAGEITMTATTASDPYGVEYYFECLTAGGHDSGWQDSPVYTDTGLASSSNYTYRVQARDKGPAQNANGFSGTASATTIDSAPPTISVLDPVNSAVGVPLTANLVATFNEPIAAGTGTVTLTNLTAATAVSMDVTNAALVIVAGSSLTINPAADLVRNNDYAVMIDGGAVTDLSANPFAGIADTATWAFSATNPPPEVTFVPTTTASPESIGVVTGYVMLSYDFSEVVTVEHRLATPGGTATDGDDFTYTSDTLVFAPGETNKNVTLTVADDSEQETDETIILELGILSNAVAGVDDTFTVTIQTDVLDDPPTVTFAQPTGSGAETNASAGVTVLLSKLYSGTTSVDVVLSAPGTTAAEGQDFTFSGETLVFEPGVTNLPVSFTIIDDTEEEGDETVALTFGAITNGSAGAQNTFTYTILAETLDIPPTVTFSPDSAAGEESGTPVTATVALSKAYSGTTTVDVAVSPSSTAEAPADYTFTPATLVFQPGVTNLGVSFSVVDDIADELDETVILSLTAVSNGVAGAGSNFVYTILADANDWSLLPFYEDFEDRTLGDLDGQHGWESAATWVQDAVTFGGSDKAGAITNLDGEVGHAFTGGHTGVWIDVRMQIAYSEEPPLPAPDRSAAFYVSTNGQVMAYDGPTPVAVGRTVAEGEWERFTIFVDYATATWKLYVASSPAGSYGFFNPGNAAFNECRVYGEATYLDDIAITTTRPALPYKMTLILVK